MEKIWPKTNRNLVINMGSESSVQPMVVVLICHSYIIVFKLHKWPQFWMIMKGNLHQTVLFCTTMEWYTFLSQIKSEGSFHIQQQLMNSTLTFGCSCSTGAFTLVSSDTWAALLAGFSSFVSMSTFSSAVTSRAAAPEFIGNGVSLLPTQIKSALNFIVNTNPYSCKFFLSWLPLENYQYTVS